MSNEETKKKDIFAEINDELKREEEKTVLAQQIANKIKPMLTELNKSERKSLIYYIRLGEILLKAKIALGSKFKELITDKGLVSPKQVQRYIKLCLTLESMDKYGDCKTSAQFKELELDKRVIRLTEKGIEDFENATQANINRMKKLKTDTLFNDVISGHSKILKKSANFIKTPNPPKTEKTPDPEKKPALMEDDTFKELYNSDIYELIIKLHQAETDASDAKEDAFEAIKAAKEHLMKLDNEVKKTRNERERRKKAEAELKKVRGLVDQTKAPIDQEKRIQ